MFEVGRAYKVTTRDGDENGYITATVLEVNLPLVKFSSPGSYIIINTAAPSFVSALPNDDAAKAAEAAIAKGYAQGLRRTIVDVSDGTAKFKSKD